MANYDDSGINDISEDLEEQKNQTQDNINSARDLKQKADDIRNRVNNPNNISNPNNSANTNGSSTNNAFSNNNAKEGVKNSANNAGKDAAKENAKENAKEAGKEVAKEGTKEVAKEAAESGGNPFVLAAKIIAKATKGEIESLGSQGTMEGDLSLRSFIAGPILMLLFIIIFGVFFLKETTGSVKNHSGNSFNYKMEESGNDNLGTNEQEFSNEKLADYKSASPFKEGATAYIYGIDENSGLRYALHEAVTDKCYHLVRDLDSKLDFSSLSGLWNSIKNKFRRDLVGGFFSNTHYKAERSLDYFLSQNWPYDLGKHTVGDVINGSYEPTYNDVNFLEMLSIICMNEKYNWDNCEFEVFNEYICSDDVQQYYYELDVKYVLIYVYDEEINENGQVVKIDPVEIDDDTLYDTLEAMEAGLDAYPTKEIGGHQCEVAGFYIQTTLKPFGLRELYLLADVLPSDPHRDFKYHTNEELLDRTERLTYTYLREDKDLAGVYFENNRSKESTIYDDLMEYYGDAKGRSAWYYIANPINIQAILYKVPTELVNYLLRTFKDLPEGSNSLADMDKFMDLFWLRQQDIQARTGRTGLCCFTSYMMLAQYYSNVQLSDTQIDALAKTYTKSNGFTDSPSIRSQFGLSATGLQGFNKSQINKSIDAGNPVLLWCGEGRTSDGNYHKTHFMVIVGYDKNGVYVADPASNSGEPRYESLANIVTWQNASVNYVTSAEE